MATQIEAQFDVVPPVKADAMETRKEMPPVALAPPQALTPMAMIDKAIEKGVSVEQLGQLMDLQMRWEANEAKKAFIVAMNRFKENPPEITKNKRVSYGKGDNATTYDHATLDHVCQSVSSALSKQGISHRWKTSTDPKIRVTCILTHGLGHSEETTLDAGPDTSGGKNAIQAIGSTVSYLQRYTLLASVGLAPKGVDDDAQGASTLDDIKVRIEEILKCPDLDSLQKTFTTHYQFAKKEKAKMAMLELIEARDVRRGELR